jgi:small neutral amino acid transporter SnatA (MarC family)
MDNSALLTFATAMFTILNPIGNVAIFAGMVSDRSTADRRSVAIKSSIAVRSFSWEPSGLGKWFSNSLVSKSLGSR